MPYATWEVLKGPPILQDSRGIGPRVLKAFGAIKDDILARQKEAVAAGWPGLAPADALAAIGKDRGLPRIAGETDLVYAERLRTAWDTWALAGSRTGLLAALTRAGYPAAGAMYLIEESGTQTRYVSGAPVFGTLQAQLGTGRPGWDFDDRSLGTRFALLFDTDNTATLDPSTTAGAASVATIISLAIQWKPADATFWGIYVQITGKTYGWPVGTTWGSFNWGGNSVRQIRPDGTYAVLGP